jgi:hypothetical protein
VTRLPHYEFPEDCDPDGWENNLGVRERCGKPVGDGMVCNMQSGHEPEQWFCPPTDLATPDSGSNAGSTE